MKIFESYRDIKSFTDTKFNKNIGDFFITRPLSIWLTVPFANQNVSPNQITIFRIIIQSIILTLIFFANNNYFTILVILYYFFSDVLDYVDGNFARYKNKASYFGKLLDTTFDNSLNFVFFIAVIYFLNNNNYSFKYFPVENYYIFFCIYIIFFWFEKYSTLLSKKYLDEVKKDIVISKSQIDKRKIEHNNRDKIKINFLQRIINFFTFVKINFVYGVVPIIFFITGFFEEYYIILFLSFFINFILTQPLNFKNYYQCLNIHRISNIDIKNKK